MTDEKLYLRRNVVVEPLVDQWYAWAHLIPPATAAMNVVGRHLKIMESYVKAPQVHAAAVRNPAMLGGPFIDYPEPRVAEIQALIARTKRERAHLIELADAIQQLDELLRQEARGYSLEPLYGRVPERLRGYVELVYDLNHQPSFRLIEPLLYRSPYYQPSAQGLMLSLTDRDDRPFVLSTPRLPDPGDVYLQRPFHDPAVDELFKMKAHPQTLGYIREVLGLDDAQTDAFARLLTPEPPPPYEPYQGTGVRWRYFGHACILVETAGLRILLDPVLSYTYESDISRYTYEDLPDRIDFALITHNHQDHILFETMLQLRHKIGTVVVPRSGGGALQDPSLKLMLRQLGFPSVYEMDELDTLDLGDAAITGLPFLGEHADLNIRTKLAYLCRIGRHSLLFAADSCNVDPRLYERLYDLVGDVDAAFLGMECDGAPLSWVYGPLLTKPVERRMDQERRLAGSNYERAIDIVNRFRCRDAYVYAMGQEPWLNYIMSVKYTEQSNPIIASNKLIEDCLARGVRAERLFGEKEILLA
jgi:L-ascorbate metabolism protein UlaG (beta-lactamase superfamily)